MLASTNPEILASGTKTEPSRSQYPDATPLLLNISNVCFTGIASSSQYFKFLVVASTQSLPALTVGSAICSMNLAEATRISAFTNASLPPDL